MRIERCCAHVRLPGGERKWRKMARLAKFDASIRVRGFKKSDEYGRGRIVLGTMSTGGRVITIHVNHKADHVHGRGDSDAYNPLATFGHELGHFILRASGRQYLSPQHKSDTKGNAVERACDRYSRILRDKS